MTSLVKTPTFTTKKGVVLHLQGVPFLLLADFMNESDAPQPPIRVLPAEYTLGRIEEPDYNDPVYLEKRAVYDSEHSVALLRICAGFAVLDDPPEGDRTVRLLRAIDSRMTDETLKIRWLEAMFTDQAELGEFIEAVISITMATEEALDAAASEERFRSVRGRDSGHGNKTQKRASNGRVPIAVGDAVEGSDVYGVDVG